MRRGGGDGFHDDEGRKAEVMALMVKSDGSWS